MRNRAEQILECLASLARTRGVSFETVVVDDASSDDTAAAAEKFGGGHPDLALKLVRNEKHLGMSGARNVGVEHASAEIVAFTDSDCVVEPTWLERLISGFGSALVAGVSGAVVEPLRSTVAERAFRGTSIIDRDRRQGRRLIGCNMALRTSVLRAHPFDPGQTYYCDEDDLAWRLRAVGWRFEFVPDARVEHRHHLDLRAFLRMGWRQGRGAARFHFKRRVFVGRDVLLPYLAFLVLPLACWGEAAWIVVAGLLSVQVPILAFAEMRFKGKSLSATLPLLPALLAHNLVKTTSVLWHTPRLLLDPPSPHAPRRDAGPGPGAIT